MCDQGTDRQGDQRPQGRLGPARKLVVKLIDASSIPEMRKDELASAAKELKRLETAIPEKKKAFVKAGGKL
jgi:hypothetical protein